MDEKSNGNLTKASLGALGIVFGDIGTSPLYALRECFENDVSQVTVPNVYGALSLILWSLLIVVSVKYLALVMRADNDGEGGILALLTMTRVRPKSASARLPLILLLGVFGAALLYGDGMITPAISVLSAVEGLHVVTSTCDPFVLPITIAILIVLFVLQKRGTAKVAKIFWPVMIVWFLVIGGLGVLELAKNPNVLAAISPHYAAIFLYNSGPRALAILGGAFLVVTGGEALYADMGHFGRRPIRMAWFVVVLPALVLNYFGQGALLIADPDAIRNPFYLLAPQWATIPLVGLAMLATVIASQAVISGAFSLTSQAVELGYLPRVAVRHTSTAESGQVYVPLVNWFLFVAVVILVLQFRTSTNLAGAYGMAVSMTMLITSVLFYFVARQQWTWPLLGAAFVTAFFIVIDMGFLIANVTKFFAGGWIPTMLGVGACVVIATWIKGRLLVAERLAEKAVSPDEFLKDVAAGTVGRIPHPAVYMASNLDNIPMALHRNFCHNRALHEPLALLTIDIQDHPWVSLDDRLEVTPLGHNVYRLEGKYGYKQQPNAPNIVDCCRDHNLFIDDEDATYFLSRISLDLGSSPAMTPWRKSLFILLSRMSEDVTSYFQLPADRVVEIGTRVEL